MRGAGRRPPLLAAAALLWGGAACVPDPSVPDGAQLTCAADAECPPGYLCRAVLGRCVRARSGDEQPPSVVPGTAVVAPRRAGRDREVTVSFDVSEPLEREPEVLLGTQPPRRWAFRSVDGARYVYAYRTDGTEGEQAWPVVAALLDRSGNIAAEVPLGTLPLDFTAPVLSDVVAERPFVGTGAAAALRFRASEPLADAMRVTFDDGTALVRDPDTAPPLHRFLQPAGDDRAGPVHVRIEAEDLAGNVADRLVSEAFTFDAVPPALAGPAVVATPSLRAGQTAVVHLTATEPLSEPPVVELRAEAGGPALPLAMAERFGETYTYLRPVDPRDLDGIYEVWHAGLRDRAGNTGDPARLGQLVVDRVAPVFTQPPALDHASGTYRAQDGLELSLEVGEPLDAAGPRARLETDPPRALDCAVEAGLRYRCRLSTAFDGTERPEGLVRLSLEIADPAGNTTVEALPVTLDFTPPAPLEAGPSTAVFKRHDTIFYTVIASEPLAEPPEIRVFHDGVLVPGYFGAPAQATDTAFTFRRAGAAALDLDYSVELDLVDRAENRVVGAAGEGFRVDAIAPAVAGEIAHGKARPVYRAGEQIALSFSVTEPLAAPPTVLLDTTPAERLTCASTGTLAYGCTLDAALDGTERPEDVVGLRLELGDQAGNLGFASSSAQLDFTPPRLVAGSERLSLVPGASNPLGEISAVTIGSAVQVSFSVTEPVASAPVVSTSGLPALPFTQVSAAGTFFAYRHTLAAAAPEGRYDVEVRATDPAGNSAVSVLALPAPGFVVRVQPPAAPDVGRAGAVVYHRVPWGAARTGGARAFQLEGAVGAVPAGAVVLAYDRADVATGSELGRTRALADGSFAAFDLARVDRPSVYVVSVDEAGNRSDGDAGVPGIQAVPVRDVAWTASLGEKEPGSTFENPTVLATVPALRRTLQQDALALREPSSSELRSLVTAGGPALTRSGEPVWTERFQSAAKPSDRMDHALVADPVRGRVMLIGGNGGRNDLWAWDGAAGLWTTPSLVGGTPPLRGDYHAAYDGGRGRIVLFGGWTGGYPWRDVWELDLAASRWIDRTPATFPTAWPAGRGFHAVAYDPARGVVVLFGGRDLERQFRDLWEWSGAEGRWINRTPATLPAAWPSLREGHELVWDEGRGRILLVGGRNATGPLGDVWEWDGVAGTWIERTPASGGPSPRWNHGLAYDRARSRVVLVAGHTGPAAFLSPTLRDVWEWDGATGTWTDRTPASLPAAWPRGRDRHDVAYDAVRDRIVLFGGEYAQNSTWLGDTWEWDPAAGTWLERTPVTPASPGPSQWHASAFDSTRGTVLVVCPLSGASTWEWDGALGRWANLTSGPHPAARNEHAVAYDPTRRKLVLFGGVTAAGPQDDTWEWDSATMAWTNRAPASRPPARSDHVLAFDPARGRIVLYGGKNAQSSPLGDLWEWDGVANGWTNRTPAASPPGRSGTALASDPVSNRLVLFGGLLGGNFARDTWEWNGAAGAWTSRTPATFPASWPAAQSAHAMAFDRLRRKAILLPNRSLEVGEWDGSGWTFRGVSGAVPSPRNETALAFDERRGRTVLFGGYDGAVRQDTWELDGGARQRPAVLWRVPFASAGATGAELVGLSVSVRAGGRGATDEGVAVNGSELLAWDARLGAWSRLESNPLGPAASIPDEPLRYETTDAAVATRLLEGTQQVLTLVVAPSATGGAASALGEIAVQQPELTVRYRR